MHANTLLGRPRSLTDGEKKHFFLSVSITRVSRAHAATRLPRFTWLRGKGPASRPSSFIRGLDVFAFRDLCGLCGEISSFPRFEGSTGRASFTPLAISAVTSLP